MAQVYLGIAAVLVALGHWAGLLPTANEMVPAGIAVFIVCHLLVGLWIRSRVQPVAGDRVVLPNLILGSVAMLLAVLPRLFFPRAEWVQSAALFVSLVLLGVMWVSLIRRRRALRQSGPPS
jgi:hypothetical protein